MTLPKRRCHCTIQGFLLALLCCLLVACVAQADLIQKERYFVDFDYAKQVAPDTVAWLYQPGGIFNTPLLYSEDHDHYLRYRPNGTRDSLGSLFFTGEKAPDFTEPLLLVHGNNTYDGSLLGSLNCYRNDEDYYAQNATLYLITPDGCDQLDVFAGLRVNQSDDYTWLPPNDPAGMMEMLPEILERSFLTPLPDTLPEDGDQWLILTAEGKSGSSARYILYTRRRPMIFDGSETWLELTEIDLDCRETLNDTFAVPGVGEWMVYGQNDPSWDRLIFETATSSRKRPFGDGGCGPTSVALAIANLLEPEDLCKINDYALDPYGYTICSCSLTQPFCKQAHIPYRLDEPEEVLRYFPLIIGNFATGNNTLGVQGRYDRFGSSMEYLPALCRQVYGITMEEVNDKETAFAFLQAGKGMAVTCTGSRPFTTNTHFITLAGADDEYVYILDPLRRDEYNDPNERLEILTPGLVRMKRTTAEFIMMSPIYLLSLPETEAPVP